MRTNYEIRYAAHPEDAKSYDTKRIRRDFLIEKVFSPNEVNMVYSMYDRMVVGGAMPVGEVLQLEAINPSQPLPHLSSSLSCRDSCDEPLRN
jgi:4-deoxy-L-threo-5-hexosulose-uronate ketol-isomerase